MINFKNLATISPHEIFSIMSYCNHDAPGHNQGRWMDVHHHEEIIKYLQSLDGKYLASADAVTSDLFSGSVIFSPNGEVLGAELDSVFSRPRHSLPAEESEFNLELRDLSGSAIRNIPFVVRFHPRRNGLENTVSVNFSVIVPNPPRYDSIAVTKDGIEVVVVERSVNSPVLSVIGPPPNEFYNHDDIINIDWEGSDADGDDLLYRVYYSTDGGANYQILSLDTEETSNCTITGTDGDDILRGTSGDDVICGLGGDDSIDGRSGNDTIYGGPGDDTIYARAGDDIVHGGLGNDLILGHRGDDVIYGSLGDDIAYGGEGNDRIIGGEGDDELYGEADDDRLEGNDGDDKIHGGRGNDTIWGDQGNDSIRGNTGKDTITPGPGENTILGISPDDTIY